MGLNGSDGWRGEMIRLAFRDLFWFVSSLRELGSARLLQNMIDSSKSGNSGFENAFPCDMLRTE